jgi:cyclin E
VYRLHRETYHLALDFVDRYLATQTDIPKQQLQLIGTFLLFN